MMHMPLCKKWCKMHVCKFPIWKKTYKMWDIGDKHVWMWWWKAQGRYQRRYHIYIYIYLFIFIYIYIWFYFCFYVHRTCSPQPGRCSTLIYNRHDHHHDHPDHHWIIIIIIITTITPSHHYHHHIKICHPLWTRCWIRDQKSPPSMNNMLGRRGRLAPFLLTWPCLKKQLRRNNKLAGLWKLRTWMVCQHYTFTRT